MGFRSSTFRGMERLLVYFFRSNFRVCSVAFCKGTKIVEPIEKTLRAASLEPTTSFNPLKAWFKVA